MASSESEELALLAPWEELDSERRQLFEMELAREIGAHHLLHDQSAHALAHRIDCDDVLFALPLGRVAVVHLTWSGVKEPAPEWPSTVIFEDLDRWRELCMKPDHREWAESE